jgi:hypothetical protein
MGCLAQGITNRAHRSTETENQRIQDSHSQFHRRSSTCFLRGADEYRPIPATTCRLPTVHSIRNSNQFQIVRRKDFPFRVLHFLGMAKAPLDFPAFINALAPNARMHFVALRFVPIIGE